VRAGILPVLESPTLVQFFNDAKFELILKNVFPCLFITFQMSFHASVDITT